MGASKRFYWMKLKENFMTSDTVDFLMSQPNGAEYVVLYQMLCLQTLNTDGVLGRVIGEVMIPYDAAKIQRDCKYFSIDTVTLALGYYKRLGLVYEQENGFLRIANYENIIGSETDSAERMRQKRSEKAVLAQCSHNVRTIPAQCSHNVTQEIEIEKENKNTHSIRAGARESVREGEVGFSAFTPPTLDEVKTFVEARGLDKVDAERFFNWFSASDWYRGRTRVVNWQAEACNWQRRGIEEAKTGGAPGEQNRGRGVGSKIETENTSKNFAEREYTHEQCDSVFTNIADIEGVEL